MDLARIAKVSDHKQGLAEEFHKPIIRKFKERKLHSPFIDNICNVDLINMPLLSKFNKGAGF